MRPRALAALAVVVLAAAAAVPPAPEAGASVPGLRLNQMQVIGSHNSYHVEPPPEVLEQYIAVVPSAIELAYTHAPLPEQFDHQGVRQIELDVFADPTGDLWRPTGRAGYKVFHIEQLDMGSTCEVLVDCLSQVKAWSDGHPGHLPLAVQLEVKDSADLPVPPDPVPVTPALLRDLDDEIRSVFPDDRLLTPDDVRGGRSSLEEAVLTDGWPRIDDVRGQVMFLLDNRRDAYVDGDPSLTGRVAFPPSEPGLPDAAFLKRNDPFDPEIPALVAAGYMVRTRADSPVVTPQACDTTQREAALASGAQWVSTDYPVPGLADRWGCDYVAAIPGGTPARCNPVNAPPGCVSTDAENPATLVDWPPDEPVAPPSSKPTAAAPSSTAMPASGAGPGATAPPAPVATAVRASPALAG